VHLRVNPGDLAAQSGKPAVIQHLIIHAHTPLN
jgi:hypothetical protein